MDEDPRPAANAASAHAAPAISDASKKRKGETGEVQSEQAQGVAQADVGVPPSVETKGGQNKRRKVYGVMTEQQAEEHWKVEGEDAEEWIAPEHRMSDSEIAKMNAAYGY